MTTTRTLTRCAALAAVVIAAAVSAQAGIKNVRVLAQIARQTPAPVRVEKGSEMQLAEHTARQVGGEALWGIGQSMVPLYAPNTAVVVKPIAYDDVKKGMTLVYRKPDGRLVAHSVIGEDGRGYIVQGVNNDEVDEVSVNERNLVGVVAAAYSANTGGFHQMIAAAANAKNVAMR